MANQLYHMAKCVSRSSRISDRVHTSAYKVMIGEKWGCPYKDQDRELIRATYERLVSSGHILI